MAKKSEDKVIDIRESQIENNTKDMLLSMQELLMKTKALNEKEKDMFYMRLRLVNAGMQFKRDTEIMKRISVGQNIRVINLITTSPEERKKYLESSYPEIKIVETR